VSIPRYAELVEPLQQFLTESLRPDPENPRRNPAKNALDKTVWDNTLASRFREINATIAESVTLSYPDQSMVTCVFTDASEHHCTHRLKQSACKACDGCLLKTIRTATANIIVFILN
jgi:hypothetical protein